MNHQAFCVDIEGDHQVDGGDQQDGQDGLPVGAGAPHTGVSVLSQGEVSHSVCQKMSLGYTLHYLLIGRRIIIASWYVTLLPLAVIRHILGQLARVGQYGAL